MNKTLFWENIRKNWMIAVAGYLMYFLNGPFIVLSGGYEDFFGENVITGLSLGTMSLSYFLPAACTVMLFSYLNKSASCSVMHSMPFSRKTLYITNTVSGLVLSVAPAVLNAITLIIVRYMAVTNTNIGNELGNIRTIFTWFVQSFVMTFFVFAVCVLAAMVSGNNVISVLTGIGFNALIPALYAVILGYASTFIFGFSMTDSQLEVAIKFHPVLRIFIDIANETNENVYKYGWIYCMVAALILIAGYFVYSKRKLENAGDSYVFPIVKTIIGFLITFFASSLVGLLCYSVYGTGSGYVAFAISAVIGFIVAKMIITKSPKIFDLHNLKELVITAAIIGAIVSVFSLDLFGYEKNIPNLSAVENLDFNCYYFNFARCGRSDIVFENTESIKAAEDFHQYIIDNKNECRKGDTHYSVDFTYIYKNGKTMRREYSVSYDILRKYDKKELLDSAEYNEGAQILLELDTEKINNINLEHELSNWTLNLTKAEKDELIKCISNDIKNRNIDGISLNNHYDYVFDQEDTTEVSEYYLLSFEYSTSNDEEYDKIIKASGYAYDYYGAKYKNIVLYNYEIYEFDTETWNFIENIRNKVSVK